MGERIRALREGRGVKPADLARSIGIKQPSLFDIESGRTKGLRGNTLTRLCEELRTTADFLLHGTMTAGSLELAAMEAELTYTIRTLTPERRVALIEYARFLMAQQPNRQPPQEKPGDAGSNIKPIRKPPRSR